MFTHTKKYIKTAQTALYGRVNGGIIYLFPDIFIEVIWLLPLMFLWRVIAAGGRDAGMTLTQLMTYTYMNALLANLLVVQTFTSSWNYEGQLLSLYARPFPVFGQIISQTAGEWIPKLLVFSLPMYLIAPVFGISRAPATPWFFPSLLLCVSLGFAIDFIFSCVTIRLRGMAWLGYAIRRAVSTILSGTIIPFRIMPSGLQRFFELQPFGSLGGAPLSLYVGSAEPGRIIVAQIFWNIVLWAAAVIWFKQSKERQVSYGG